MPGKSASAVSAFIDLATYDEIEKYLYGYDDAITYFVRQTKKCTWFSQIPVKLTNGSGTPAFGKEFSYHVSRSGDYLLNTWLRVKLNAAKLKHDENTMKMSDGTVTGVSARYTNNLMHNLVKKVEIRFNDLSAQEVKSFHMDFWRCFTIPASKRMGYHKMIGNTKCNQWVNSADANPVLGDAVLNLPLPLFYDRDSGSALPTAALPYNDMRVHFEFRDWDELVIVDKHGNGPAGQIHGDGSTVSSKTSERCRAAVLNDFEGGHHPKIVSCELWANYAIVSQKERQRMGKNTRDIVIEQVQHAPVEEFKADPGATKHYDLRFSHAVKAVFFAVRNKTCANEWSNYSSSQNSNGASNANPAEEDLTFPEGDILQSASLVYENTTRLGDMGVDYYTLVNPYYHATADGTDQPGVCMYSYSLALDGYDPMGSTNYGKLTNVTLSPTAGPGAANVKSDSDFLVSVVNYNVIRISGGALGFPVL